MKNDLLEKVYQKYPESIKEPYAELVDKIGFKNVMAIAEEFGGGNLYILTKKKMFRDCIARAIREEYNGKNIRCLAKKYDYTVNSIVNILNERVAENG